jgi:hypothetical protein
MMVVPNERPMGNAPLSEILDELEMFVRTGHQVSRSASESPGRERLKTSHCYWPLISRHGLPVQFQRS